MLFKVLVALFLLVAVRSEQHALTANSDAITSRHRVNQSALVEGCDESTAITTESACRDFCKDAFAEKNYKITCMIGCADHWQSSCAAHCTRASRNAGYYYISDDSAAVQGSNWETYASACLTGCSCKNCDVCDYDESPAEPSPSPIPLPQVDVGSCNDETSAPQLSTQICRTYCQGGGDAKRPETRAYACYVGCLKDLSKSCADHCEYAIGHAEANYGGDYFGSDYNGPSVIQNNVAVYTADCLDGCLCRQCDSCPNLVTATPTRSLSSSTSLSSSPSPSSLRFAIRPAGDLCADLWSSDALEKFCPDPLDCSKYYRRSSGTILHMDCGGMYFDISLNVCQVADQVDCHYGFCPEGSACDYMRSA